MFIKKLNKNELLMLNNIRNRILTFYDYPELVVPNIEDICCYAIAETRKEYGRLPKLGMPYAIYTMNNMDDKELKGIADDLFYWNSQMAYRDRKPSLMPWLQDIADNLFCSRKLSKYLKHRSGYCFKLLDKPKEHTAADLLIHKVDKNEFYGLLKIRFNITLLSISVHRELLSKAADAHLHSYYLFTPNDIEKYGLQDVAHTLYESGLVPTKKQINDRLIYNKEVEQVYDSIVLAAEKEV